MRAAVMRHNQITVEDLPVPNGLATDHAALTEPMAVGVHAVAKARLEADDVPLVSGCGPLGLAVIGALKLAGVAPIVAADYSARRRELALAMGADVVVDAGLDSPFSSWREAAVWRDPVRAWWWSGCACSAMALSRCSASIRN